MNNNYDVYMCRVQDDSAEEILRRIHLLTASPYDLLKIKPTTLYLFGSPSCAMPTKSQIDGVAAIFKRNDCFEVKDE